MPTLRTTLALCGIAALAPTAAHAQLDDRTVVSILHECRKIADTAARTACYDNIPLGPAVTGAQPPDRAPVSPPAGFGSNQLPPERAPARSAEPDRLAATLTAATMVTPGIYRLTLADGAQWQFVDAVSSSYDPPRRDSKVEIVAASLGSYLMTYAGQRAVRIRRIR